MITESNVSPIPVSLKPCFQEYTFSRLDPETDGSLIIERTLAKGNREELRWLFGRYGRERIVTWMTSPAVSRLPRRRFHLWCTLLELPQDELSALRPSTAWPH